MEKGAPLRLRRRRDNNNNRPVVAVKTCNLHRDIIHHMDMDTRLLPPDEEEVDLVAAEVEVQIKVRKHHLLQVWIVNCSNAFEVSWRNMISLQGNTKRTIQKKHQGRNNWTDYVFTMSSASYIYHSISSWGCSVTFNVMEWHIAACFVSSFLYIYIYMHMNSFLSRLVFLDISDSAVLPVLALVL